MRVIAAALLFAALPAQADQPAAPTPAELAARLHDPAQRRAAAVALLRLGEPGAKAIAALLADDKASMELAARELALDVLYHLGPLALPAVDALLASLSRKELQSLRTRTLQTLGHCVPWHPERAKAASLAISAAAADDSFLGTTGFFATLSRLQVDASADSAELLAALSHKNGYARELAAEILELRARSLDPSLRKATIEAITQALADEHPTTFQLKWTWKGSEASTSGGCDNQESMRVALARALAALDPLLPETMPGHRDRLRHLDPRVRQEAARALGQLGSAAVGATGALVRALEDHESVAREAATALGLIGDQSPNVRQGLEAAAGSPDKQLAVRAKAALNQLERGG